LDEYTFSAKIFIEKDKSITLSLNEIDLIENALNEQEARALMGNSIIEYAKEYFTEFCVWGEAVNRKRHLPYVFKALLINDSQKIGDSILCRLGGN
jgi:hypothetical protein